MKNRSRKGVLLFVAVVAVGAFALPSMASASSWAAIGTEHTLESLDFGFTSMTVVGSITAQCTRSSLTATVSSAQALEITTGTFGGSCTAFGPNIGTCLWSAVGTRFPWTATAVTTSNVQIHGVFIDVTFLQTPSNTCFFIQNANFTITGTVSNGFWTGNGGGQHSFFYANASGLVSHSGLGNNVPVALRGTFRDTAATLTVN
jgi:hypothetical protein